MAKFNPITYYPVLVSLNDGLARFERVKADGLPEFGVDIPFEYWIKMGRPGSVRYTPDAWVNPEVEWVRETHHVDTAVSEPPGSGVSDE